MANEENLLRPEDLTPSERRENASKAGKASGEARRRRKNMRECMSLLLKTECFDADKWNDTSAMLGSLDEDITNQMVVVAALLDKAQTGDVAAIKEVRSIIGDDERLKIERERLELERQKMFPPAPEPRAYSGIPANMIAPSFSSVHFDIADSAHSEYVFPGGRGSTKSSFISLEIIDILETNPELHACVMRQVGDTLRTSVYAQIKWAISALGLDDEYSYTVSPLEITKIATGQKIYFRGADDYGKIKSIKVPFGYIGIAWFEELDQFKGAEDVRKIEQSLIRGGDKAYKFKSFNPPRSAQNWANKYVKIPRADRLVIESNYLSVPAKWLGKPFFDDAEFLKATNPTAYENEYLGAVNGSGGNVFDNVTIRAINDDEISAFDRIYHGVDWGWYPDPYAYTRMHYDAARHTLYIFDEFRANKMSNENTAAELKRRGVKDDDIITCDSAEMKSVGDYKSYGLFARGAKKGPGSVEYSMKWLQSLRGIVIDNVRCPKTAEEFLNYEYDRDKEGNVITGYPDRDNHSIDSVRYALESVWKRNGE
ncbi:MAG: PBSX family phage terminase large subunit [Clostridia bacterium]|nr:PBSX family phage terminase large subunit [Clostridia bacterium]